MHVSASRAGTELTLGLEGAWRALEFEQIRSELDDIDLSGVESVRIDTGSLESMDLATAWVLRRFLVDAVGEDSSRASFVGEPPESYRLLSTDAPSDSTHRQAAEAEPTTIVSSIGLGTFRRIAGVRDGLDFTGRVCVQFGRAARHWRQLRFTSITRHVYETGITAIPIVSLIAFLISVIIAYMSAQQLRDLGADIYVVDLVTIGVLRELGVLLTAIIVAGRSGSAFAAEIGSMKLNQEVDALVATGVDPIEVLVLPRILGLVIALPLLTVIADAVGLVGGGLLCHTLLDMPLAQYINRVNESISSTTFWAGLVKAPVFAILIATAGTYRGLQVRDSSRELGRLTTVAVVQSIFLVILADALFAVLFMEIDF